MTNRINLCYNPHTHIGYCVAVTPKGERLERYRVVDNTDWENPVCEYKTVLRRDDKAMSAAVYNRSGFKYHPCPTEVW